MIGPNSQLKIDSTEGSDAKYDIAGVTDEKNDWAYYTGKEWKTAKTNDIIANYPCSSGKNERFNDMYYGTGEFTRGEFFGTVRTITFTKGIFKIKGSMGTTHKPKIKIQLTQ